ncbi:tRNA (adenosine(37)-N6)-threonylcarbamoyltransferase complex dimerization subunit type 1 TsaB [Yoonia sp. SS1-5]|uniref:tRNA (Adenosine(37)-N6)-threonylcarbamoyltransferase complex dimerization subunit type 1 TsaB n=1 Tax=Yoonia rhodophyticola TaxID=3137370 RepID=A0AAN0NLN7_9RHOB
MQPDVAVIAFDTSAAHCAAALLLGKEVITRVDEMAKGQAEHLIPMLEEMLTEGGVAWKDIDGIGVGTGPGNFTGIRIGISAARGLSLGLGKPAIGVSGFEARAFGSTPPLTAIIPAPRDKAYVQFFKADGEVSKPALMGQEFLPALVSPPAPVKLITAVAKIAAQKLDDKVERPAPLYVRSPDAAPPSDPAPVILA